MQDERDDSIDEEEKAAAAEARRIGGRSGMEGMDEAKRAAAEQGGGESEGFEEAEALLEEGATHGGPSVDPLGHLSEPEPDGEIAEYGEADEIESTETKDRTEDARRDGSSEED